MPRRRYALPWLSPNQTYSSISAHMDKCVCSKVVGCDFGHFQAYQHDENCIGMLPTRSHQGRTFHHVSSTTIHHRSSQMPEGCSLLLCLVQASCRFMNDKLLLPREKPEGSTRNLFQILWFWMFMSSRDLCKAGMMFGSGRGM